MTDFFSSFAAEQAQFKDSLDAANQANKSELFPLLDAAGITTVVVAFDGEGDSGQIESVRAFAGDQPRELPTRIAAIRQVSWPDQTHTENLALREAIEALCYGYLEQEHDGWENNDGALGEFVLDVPTRTVTLEFNARVVDSVYSHQTF